MIRPCWLIVLSMLKAWRDGIGREGRRSQSTREESMKFPVALQSMRVVVVTVLALYCSRMGNCRARLDILATITEAMLREEEDVTASSCFKKTAPWSHRHLLQFARGITTQQVSFLFPPNFSHIWPSPSLLSSGHCEFVPYFGLIVSGCFLGGGWSCPEDGS